jgi:MFS family permease
MPAGAELRRPSTPPGTASRSAPAERAVLAAAGLASMLLPLNSTMIAVALPGLARDLDVGVHAATWLVTAYLIAMASLQPLAGKLGDRYGRRPIVLGGLAAFAAASLGAALAPDLPVLIALRVGQAAAGALVFPNAMAVVREALPEHRRAAGYGLLGSAIGLAAAVGPPLGGALDGLWGWRALFLVNVPLVAGALVLSARTIAPATRPSAARAPFDAGGAALLCALLVAAALLLNSGIGALPVAAGAAALTGALGVFVRRELRHPDPVLQPRLLRRRAFAAATGAVGLSNLALYATLLAVPVVASARGWGGGRTGLVLAALSVIMVVLSPFGGRLADRHGRRALATAGLVLLAAALVPLALGGGDVGAELLVAALALAGAGLGLANAAIQTAAVESLPARDAGVAAGMFGTGRYLGSIASASLVAALLGGGAHHASALFAITVAAALGAALLGLALPGRTARLAAEPAPARPAARAA